VNADDALRYARAWGLEPLGAVQLAGGFSNESFRVAARGRNDVVVRRYGRLHVTRNAVFFEHAVQRYAAERCPGVGAPCADESGETLRLLDGAYVGVLPYAPGATGERTAYAPAAALLAAFHRATIGFRAAHPRATRTLGTLGWLRERFGRFAADAALARALDWDALAVAVAGATARIAPLATRLPLSIVHADAHPDNVVTRAGSAVALIDFDFVHETERAYDVATAADAYARADDDAPLDPELFLAYARAYDAAAPLARAEWDALWDLAIRRNAMLAWYVVTRHSERARGDVGRAPRYVARARELAHYARERGSPHA
jgi:Ser/Thr protein kinase RdoA (MazF antagonist)